MAHPELRQLLVKVETIYEDLQHFRPLAFSPPILDSSASVDADKDDDVQWLRQEAVPGIKKLRESIKYDIDLLQKFLSDPKSESQPPISTHAPYLLAVYNEILCAPSPVTWVFKFVTRTKDDVKSRSIHKDGGEGTRKGQQRQKERLSKSDRKAAAKAHNATLDPPGQDRREKGKRVPTTKIDVVAENGKRWIRVNTIKMSGILAELREIDSYLTDSDSNPDSDDPDHLGPSLAQKEFDNSVLQMGRGLLEAAAAHPVDGPNGPHPPRITMRLTRLNISPANDPRIAQTVQNLRDMGIDVELGERHADDIPALQPAPPLPTLQITPTRQINLDLSVLVAVVSDLTHSPLPTSVEEATTRFLPPQQYRDWRPQTGEEAKSTTTKQQNGESEGPSQDVLRHSRALTMHVLQEMRQGFLQEIYDRLPLARGADSDGGVEFWTSDEAKERCLRIVSRIGGPREIRRAEALFVVHGIPLEEAERLFWAESRYPQRFVRLFPIRMYPARDEIPLEGAPKPHGKFFQALTRVCRELLAHVEVGDGAEDEGHGHLSKATSRLSPHAVKSMLRGAELGWTTLTTTKSSVKSLLREVKLARLDGWLGDSVNDDVPLSEHESKAALWIVDPRNLQCFA